MELGKKCSRKDKCFLKNYEILKILKDAVKEICFALSISKNKATIFELRTRILFNSQRSLLIKNKKLFKGVAVKKISSSSKLFTAT